MRAARERRAAMVGGLAWSAAHLSIWRVRCSARPAPGRRRHRVHHDTAVLPRWWPLLRDDRDVAVREEGDALPVPR